MFSTSLKTISTVLAAAAIAVPVASGSTPRTPSVGQGFSLGVPLEYLNTGAPTHVTEGFSLGVPTEYLAQGSAPTHVSQGFSLGVPVQYLAQPTAAARGNGFDWSAAAIGAGIVAGLFLMIAGIGAMTIRARQSQRRLSAT
jgi:hypothetical protein